MGSRDAELLASVLRLGCPVCGGSLESCVGRSVRCVRCHRSFVWDLRPGRGSCLGIREVLPGGEGVK